MIVRQLYNSVQLFRADTTKQQWLSDRGLPEYTKVTKKKHFEKKICLCVQFSANQSFTLNFFVTVLHESANRKIVYYQTEVRKTIYLYYPLSISKSNSQKSLSKKKFTRSLIVKSGLGSLTEKNCGGAKNGILKVSQS